MRQGRLGLSVLAIYIEPAPYILDLIREMRSIYPDLELRALFITASASQPWGSDLEEGLELLPVRSFSAFKKLFAEVRKGGFDWLHLAGWGHPLLLATLLLGAMFGRRISVESDTQLPFGREGLKSRLKAVVYPRLFALPALLLPGGTRQMNYFRHYGVPEAKLRIARMTVNVARIVEMSAGIRSRRSELRASLGFEDDEIVFVFVGRLEPYKGIDLLLVAFGRRKLPQARLLIVGDGSCRERVEHAAAADRRIRYVGRRDFEGVVEALAVSDVAVVPSTFEPWGLVVNEAMAAGLPVIASDRVGSVDDLVSDGKTGRIFPSGDANALAVAMRELAADAGLRRRLGDQAQQRIRQWDLRAESDIIHQAWRDAGI